MKVAALDLGSNTFLCLIADVENQLIKKIYSDEVEIVRLGQGLTANKSFHPDALLRADHCLQKFAQEIKKHNPDQILAMATSAARDANNREELFAIAKKYQIPLEIIPGDQEAMITYLGATSGLEQKNKNLMVLDIGGGSTEFIFGHSNQIIKGKSFDIGCVRLTEKFILQQPTPPEQIDHVFKQIDIVLEQAKKEQPADYEVDEMIAVAGTPTSIAAAELGVFDVKKIEGYQLTQENLTSWLKKLTQASVQQKIQMGIPAGRADVILVGVIILLKTLIQFKKQSLTVSTRGVRYGVALEMDRRSHCHNNTNSNTKS